MTTGTESGIRRGYGLLVREQGSVLMETVLVVPLYLTLLAGILWSLELCTKRFEGMQVERRSAWGVRHDQAPVAGSTRAVEEVGDWYAVAHAVSEELVKMPVWIEGLFKSGEVLLGADPVQTQWRVMGREAGKGHTVVVRGSGELGLRGEPGEVVGPRPWVTIYHQPWLDEASAPERLDPPPRSDAYERHPGFVTYSK